MNILFLCVANSARSQMAEGLAKDFFKQRGIKARIASAGSEPSKLNPMAVQVMKEIKIDISNQFSKSIDQVSTEKIDTVITLCKEEVCPNFLGNAHKLHWGFEDPANPELSEKEQLQCFREVRDGIQNKLSELIH